MDAFSFRMQSDFISVLQPGGNCLALFLFSFFFILKNECALKPPHYFAGYPLGVGSLNRFESRAIYFVLQVKDAAQKFEGDE